MKIESYSFGTITIDGRTYGDDVIIYPDHVDDDWWREQGHVLQQVDLDDVLAVEPDFLVVGTGAYGRMSVPDRLRETIEDRGIELIVAKTENACRRYNEIADEHQTVAALHLTC